MKGLPWIIAGVGAGMAAYFLYRQPSSQYASGYDSVEDAADRTSFWGDRQRVSGAGNNVVGKLKEGFGRVTGDSRMADEGVGDQVAGTVQNTAGKVANAVGQTIHDLNR